MVTTFHVNSTANNVFAIYYFVVNTVVAEDDRVVKKDCIFEAKLVTT